MKQKLTVFNIIPSEKDVIKVRLPFGTGGEKLTFAQGDQLVAEVLVAGTRDQYDGKLVTTATDETVIIFNQNVYKDEFGNRHGFVQNPSLIRYESGELVTAVRPSRNVKLQVSKEAITGSIVNGQYLVPQVASEANEDTFGLTVTADATGYATAYKIEKADETIEIGNAKYVQAPIVRTM